MVGAIWRRIRSLLSGSGATTAPAAYVPDLPFAPEPEQAGPGYLSSTSEPTETTTAAYVGAATPPQPEPRPVEQLAEALTMRLVEDETLRGSLTDDEYQPLLDWATLRIAELADSCTPLPPAAAEARFNQIGCQLLELLRSIDLALGERQSSSPDLVLSRFQMLDTLLVPPLLPGPAATVAQARLEALLEQPPEQLQSTDGPTLVARVIEMLG